MATETTRRVFIMEGDGETAERQKKVAHIRDSVIYCDEGTNIGGDGSAPTPMEYFVSSIMF